VRSYASIAPTFWTRGSGRRIRGDKEAQLVALYLMSSPQTNMVGIFHLVLPTLCHETGLTLEEARKGLARCSEEQIAFWDEEEELVWVPALARYQIGEELTLGKGGKPDHRVKGVERAIAPFKGHRFYDMFLERYAASYLLTELEKEAPSKGLPSPDVPDPVPAPVKSETERPESAARPRPADPMGDSLRGNSPERRGDVNQVHERFKATIGKPSLKFREPYDSAAKAIALAIDTDGLENCLIVAGYCMHDGMVNGKSDDRKLRHDSAEYVFGNKNTFHRILAAALAAGRGAEAPKRRSASDVVREMKAQ
jgi:hypothetical protein